MSKKGPEPGSGLSPDFSEANIMNASKINRKTHQLFKVMKLKSLKPSKKMEKMYKKMLAKEKMRLKKKHFKKDQKHLTP